MITFIGYPQSQSNEVYNGEWQTVKRLPDGIRFVVQP